jgi:hypothetical protein
MEIEVNKPKSRSKSMLSGLMFLLSLIKGMMVKLKQQNSARRLASLGGSEPQLKSISRRRCLPSR